MRTISTDDRVHVAGPVSRFFIKVLIEVDPPRMINGRRPSRVTASETISRCAGQDPFGFHRIIIFDTGMRL
ncbi:MAG: hypothetical protein CMJ22_06105 [Phycisphaerae bacterium]|nr:hypothetical protein [Phycisphaerae bacterium]